MDASFVKKRASGKRAKKRKHTGIFRGNQHVLATKNPRPSNPVSASARKIGTKSDFTNINDNFSGYVVIDKDLVLQNLEKCLCCIKCHGTVAIKCTPVYGLSAKLSVTCNNCDEISTFRNSTMLGLKKNIAEINRRFTYAMRCVGIGDSGSKTFCGVMDLHPPVTQKAYETIVKKINAASSTIALQSIAKAVEEEIRVTGSNDICVSGDGTWKTRGYSSRIGVCTLVGSESGKVIDALVKSSTCKGCLQWVGERKGKSYEDWSKKHSGNCLKNQHETAGKMEVDGMIELFQRSEQQHGVRYLKYIGDGDCRTFSGIKSAEPYGEELVIKIECVGHIQKRMGTRLRKLKQDMRGKKCSDGKPLSGKGRLTDAAIDKLTTFYGNAIRQHPNSVREMQTAIWAVWYHRSSSDEKPIHHFCPKGKDSWCKYQRAVESGNAQTHKHKNSLPIPVMDQIKGIFKELSHPSLLQRCLGGKTQNCNECLNSLIWTFCPKVSGAGRSIVEIAVNEVIILFNNGQKGRLQTMSALGLKPGVNAQIAAYNADEDRIKKAEFQAESSTLEFPGAQRRKTKSREESHKLTEGSIYAPGEY